MSRSSPRMLAYTVFLFIVDIIHNVLADSRIDPLVSTRVGLIRGVKAHNGNYSMFLGIPFAQVDPANPFGSALPQPNFDGIFEANDDSTMCPQVVSPDEIAGTLDCLRLNIYVPDSATSSNRLPVMVSIYGGNFETGSISTNSYGPKFLMRHDVIIVGISYRVSVYGFLCLDIPEVPGNQGLKDQLVALRWIRNNIESFGGDVNKITLFGDSMGGRSIDFHLMSPQEKLFDKVILQSGTALIRDTIYESNPTAAFELARQLEFETDNVYDALSYLASCDVFELLAAARDIDLITRSKPCVEKDFKNVENFVTDYPVNSDVSKAKGTPILIGYNDNEQIARYGNQDPSFFDDLNIIYELLNNNFDFESDQLEALEKIVRSFYLGGKKLASQDSMTEIVAFDSHFTYNHPIERSIHKYMENGADTIYSYVFSYVGGRNVYKYIMNVTVGGASHIDDLGYLFDTYFYEEEPSAEDQLIIDRMTTMWTNFAKYGNPIPETSDLLPISWQPTTKDTRYYFNITTNLSMQTNPFHKEIAFWDLFYYLNWKLQKEYREV